jgi:hypothetical protein
VRVSWLSLKTKVDSLSMVWPQNHWDSFSRFGLKTGGDDFSYFGLKIKGDVSRFGPQNQHLWFGDLGLKIIMTVSWFEPQNHVGFGLSVAPQNRRDGDDEGYIKIYQLASCGSKSR